MRLFLAVFPPLEVREAVWRSAESLRALDEPVSWVRAENLHYTLRFLGEVGEDGARRATEAAVEAASKSRAFEAEIGGFGAFPNARRTRIVWAGMRAGAEPMTTLARDLERALRDRGFDRAEQRFTPHLTLGRVRKNSCDWTAHLGIEEASSDASSRRRFRVDRVSVVESTLSPEGSQYRARAEAPLAP